MRQVVKLRDGDDGDIAINAGVRAQECEAGDKEGNFGDCAQVRVEWLKWLYHYYTRAGACSRRRKGRRESN